MCRYRKVCDLHLKVKIQVYFVIYTWPSNFLFFQNNASDSETSYLITSAVMFTKPVHAALRKK